MDAYELESFKKGYKFVAGVDEAGRGPLAGPVIAAAVVFPSPCTAVGSASNAVAQGSLPLDIGIRDSKTLSASKRNKLLLEIYNRALSVGVGIVWMEDIETSDIHQASLMAMAIAVKKLNPSPEVILVDGPCPIANISIPQMPIVQGDSLSVSIAAASIVAKTARDNIMAAYHNIFPRYNFVNNKGYGTAEHLAAIRHFGPSPVHRRGFKGVKEYCND